MHGIRYWILQYLLAAGSMFALLMVADFVGGKPMAGGAWMSLAFALAASAIFIGAKYLRERQR